MDHNTIDFLKEKIEEMTMHELSDLLSVVATKLHSFSLERMLHKPNPTPSDSPNGLNESTRGGDGRQSQAMRPLTYGDLNLNDYITYNQSQEHAFFCSQTGNQPTHHGVSEGFIVQFLDKNGSSPSSRVGVRSDGFNGYAPLVSVKLCQILTLTKRGARQKFPNRFR